MIKSFALALAAAGLLWLAPADGRAAQPLKPEVAQAGYQEVGQRGGHRNNRAGYRPPPRQWHQPPPPRQWHQAPPPRQWHQAPPARHGYWQPRPRQPYYAYRPAPRPQPRPQPYYHYPAPRGALGLPYWNPY